MYSLVIGYVYCSIAHLIPCSISYEIDTIFIIISAIITAYFLGRLSTSGFMISLFDILSIRDTGNVYMWDDLMDITYPMKTLIEYDNAKYTGIIHNIESYTNSPHIVLGAYQKLDLDNNIILDSSNNKTQIIILNLSDAKQVEIFYNKKSKKCYDIKNLCEYWKSINN